MPFYHRAPADRGPLRPLADQTGAPVTPLPGTRGPGATRPSPATAAAGAPGGGVGAGGYAVVDLETTGLSPTTDAIIEIGLVLTDAQGRAEHSWSTLIDPGAGTAVGPTRIHGLVAEDLIGAPALAQVADLLVRDLAGRVVVAHNARFDLGFLTQALGGLGLLRRGARVPRVCTMEWSRRFMDTPSRRLTACCRAAGVAIDQHHSALDDAMAAAGLLRHYLAVGARRGEPPAWGRALEDARVFTGWTWDADRADRARALLVERRRPGALRDPRAPGSQPG
ncbi:3'-5' exonuclease [Actinomyces bowdenii]|uniref:3'-5' exonuclease n=1 Tax=Actinomyces bowdenii TaxID=131109 RepID=A0A3P1V9X3_9ACTO|nr:3'-5' exonuclease [Actinomyces bowdenii]MBO3723454.1 3'-5' exonuclease [Actinomyces bowdenii]RRD30931.1 3'-5' exonuclease [Actinomyces bowdenii]